ncbi:MAG TPA: TPM domain-containing protein [Caulobacteraceae bacterium]
MLSAIEEDRIAQAVSLAEEGSSGEIVCALAGEVSGYREVPIAWAAAAALALPPIAVGLGLHPLALAGRGGAWMAAQAGAVEPQIALALTLNAAIQVVLFALVALLVSIPTIRRLLTPSSVKRHRVARAAHHQFAAVSARATGSETGILIFVAIEDRQVQILAHAAIHQKCGETVWRQAAGEIQNAMKDGKDPTAGIVKAVEICGAALREHFPSSKPPAHSFSSRPIEV